MTVRKVSPGDPLEIPADAWNLIADSANAFETRRRVFGRTTRTSRPSPVECLIRNDTGADLEDRFQILGITGVVITPSENQPEFESDFALTGDTPDVDDHTEGFVVCQEPIKDGEFGVAVVSGLTVCTINVVSATDVLAGVKNSDSSELVSGPGPARIVYKESGTGSKLAVINLNSDSVTLWRFTLNEDMGATINNAAAADLRRLDGTDTGLDVTIEDPLGVLVDLVNDDPGYCLRQGGVYLGIQAPC